MIEQVIKSDVLIVGGGIAGLVTALECLQSGKRVTLVDRDRRERLGGLALWAFG
jgi:predicted oxidoreductase